MVRGRKMQIFWPMASPVNFSLLNIFWPYCYEQFFCARLRLPILCSFSQSFNSVMTNPVYNSIDWTFVLCFLIAILLLEMHSFSLHSLWVFFGSSLSCSVFCIAVLDSAGPLLPLLDGVLNCEIPALVWCSHSTLESVPQAHLNEPFIVCLLRHFLSMEILDLGLVLSFQDCIIYAHLFYGNEVGFLNCTIHLDILILLETLVICPTTDTICFDLFWWFLLWYYRLPILIGLYHCKLWFCSFLEHMGWYASSCSHFVWPTLINFRFFAVSRKPLSNSWLWTRLFISLLTRLSVPGSCWTFFGTFCCRNVFWPRQYRDFCVTSCFQLRQPQYLAGLSMAYDAEIFALNLSETFLIPCVQGLWQVASFFVLESCTMCLLVSLLGLDCLVWRLVVSLVCAFCSSPGSDYGFLLPLVCCWMDVCSFGLWLLFWFSVTSSFELWQPKPKAFLPMACGVMVCDACCSEANALTLCWYPGFCIHFFCPTVITTQLSSTCWHFLFGSWVWMRLSLLFPALSSVDGSWVWKIVSTVFVAFLVPGYCIGMVRIVLWLRPGLCVTGLLIFRQPQRPMVVLLVYDEDCLRWGRTETCCYILLVIVLQRCFRWHPDVFWVHDPFLALPWPSLQLGVHSRWFWFPLQLWLLLLGGFIYLPFCHVLWVSQLYILFVHFFFGILYRLIPCYTMYTSYVFGTFLSCVMVRGGKMRILPSKASPLPSSCALWCSRETFFLPPTLYLYAFFMPWIVLCHVLLTWADMLVHTFLRLDHCFTVPVHISSLEFAGWVCQHISSDKAEQAFSQFFWTFPSLAQLRTSVSRETYFWPSVLLPTDPCGSLDTRMEVYHHLFIL